MLCHIGLTGVGSIFFKKIDYEEGLPERVGTSNTTIDGPNIHIISQVRDSQKMPVMTIRVSEENRKKLFNIYESSTLICDFDDGRNTFKGYIKSLEDIEQNKNTFSYRMTFNITSKVK